MNQIIRPKALPDVVGLSFPTVRRLVKAGKFPKPLQLSRQAIGWRRDDVEAWIDSRPVHEMGVGADKDPRAVPGI